MSQQHNIQHSGYDDKGKIALSDEQLMAYMEGKLSPEERRRIEEIISEESAEADALEGLQQMHLSETKRGVAELHRKLHTELLRNKPKRKNKFSEDYWGWMAIVIILLLITVAYIMVRIASK
jgi:anti-sigma factor RsiW